MYDLSRYFILIRSINSLYSVQFICHHIAIYQLCTQSRGKHFEHFPYVCQIHYCPCIFQWNLFYPIYEREKYTFCAPQSLDMDFIWMLDCVQINFDMYGLWPKWIAAHVWTVLRYYCFILFSMGWLVWVKIHPDSFRWMQSSSTEKHQEIDLSIKCDGIKWQHARKK